MQFIITAHDGTDEGALERRMSVRPEHLENIQRVKERGSVVCAGGLLDDAGKMKGSFLVMDFDTKEAFEEYLRTEPYVTGGVWRDVNVETCNVVIVNDEVV